MWILAKLGSLWNVRVIETVGELRPIIKPSAVTVYRNSPDTRLIQSALTQPAFISLRDLPREWALLPQATTAHALQMPIYASSYRLTEHTRTQPDR